MGFYPTDWTQYVGQKAAVRQLKISAKSARARGVPMGHTLVHSRTAGIGKTALVQLVARELGGTLFVQTEPLKANQVRFLFADLKDGDVLFLDEIHKQFDTGKKGAEWLLQFLDRGVIPSAIGEEEAPRITLIGATTDVGKLTEPFLTRFPIQVPLEAYSDEEAAQIAARMAEQILVADDALPSPTQGACAAVARAACNNPRDMGRILCALRDLIWADEVQEGLADGDYNLREALAMAGFTEDGLTSRETQYLLTMLNEAHGEPIGATTLQARLGEVPQGLRLVENRLADKGLIHMTKAGRVLSKDGLARTKKLAA